MLENAGRDSFFQSLRKATQNHMDSTRKTHSGRVKGTNNDENSHASCVIWGIR